MLVIVLELYCVVVLFCNILICLSVIDGMMDILGFCVLLDIWLFKNVIIVEWWCCFLFISIKVWFGVSFFKFVGCIRVEVLLIGWLLILKDGMVVCIIVVMLVDLVFLNFFVLIMLIGIVEFFIECGVECVLMIVFFLYLF